MAAIGNSIDALIDILVDDLLRELIAEEKAPSWQARGAEHSSTTGVVTNEEYRQSLAHARAEPQTSTGRSSLPMRSAIPPAGSGAGKVPPLHAG